MWLRRWRLHHLHLARGLRRHRSRSGSLLLRLWDGRGHRLLWWLLRDWRLRRLWWLLHLLQWGDRRLLLHLLHLRLRRGLLHLLLRLLGRRLHLRRGGLLL